MALASPKSACVHAGSRTLNHNQSTIIHKPDSVKPNSDPKPVNPTKALTPNPYFLSPNTLLDPARIHPGCDDQFAALLVERKEREVDRARPKPASKCRRHLDILRPIPPFTAL